MAPISNTKGNREKGVLAKYTFNDIKKAATKGEAAWQYRVRATKNASIAQWPAKLLKHRCFKLLQEINYRNTICP
jgi:hypothetical protein